LIIRGKVRLLKVFLSLFLINLDLFFATPEGRTSRGNTRDNYGKEPSSDDFGLGSPVRSNPSTKRSSRDVTTSQRSSNRSSRQALFVQDDASDNDLGLDSS
jgi:hypothetical protein